MPAGVRKSSILGANGKPVSYFLYPSPRHNLRQYKPRYFLSPDTKSNVNEYDRWELVNYSRQLFAQIGNLSTAIKDKNSWAFGDAWDPHYTGRNAKWGEEATEFLKLQFYPMCNVRGPLYDFKTSLRLSGQMWDVDGDDGMVLTESASGFPQLAFFPSTRIATQSTAGRGSAGGKTSQGPGGIVSGGKFDGAKIFDGVIFDRNNRMIGLRIVGDDGEATDISSFNCDLAYLPDWQDQGRGIPRPATCLLRWMNLQDIDEFIQRGMKRASSIGLKFKNEDGEAAVGNEVVTEEEDLSAAGQGANVGGAGDAPKIYYEELEGGEMYYLNSSNGEDIESLEYKNPHPNSEAFVERLVRESVASVGWLYELLDLGQTGRAPTRLACDIGNQHIWEHQCAGYRRAKRAVGYAVAKAMKIGALSKNNDGIDPYCWEFGLPKPLSVDSGNDEQADRDNLKMGTTSKAVIAQKKGLHWLELGRQRKAELKQLIADAKEIHAGAPEVTFDKAMEMLEQRSPNPMPPAKPGAVPALPGKPTP